MDLINKKCIPCDDGTKPFTKDQIISYLPLLKKQWQVVDDKKITYEFVLADFKQAMTFVNKIAALAETEGHHPDIHIFYNRVIIELWTHAISGLSENDFILAAKIERLIS